VPCAIRRSRPEASGSGQRNRFPGSRGRRRGRRTRWASRWRDGTTACAYGSRRAKTWEDYKDANPGGKRDAGRYRALLVPSADDEIAEPPEDLVSFDFGQGRRNRRARLEIAGAGTNQHSFSPAVWEGRRETFVTPAHEAAGFDDTDEFGDGEGRIVELIDAAEVKEGVEGIVREGEILGVAVDEKGALVAALAALAQHAAGKIEGDERAVGTDFFAHEFLRDSRAGRNFEQAVAGFQIKAGGDVAPAFLGIGAGDDDWPENSLNEIVKRGEVIIETIPAAVLAAQRFGEYEGGNAVGNRVGLTVGADERVTVPRERLAGFRIAEDGIEPGLLIDRSHGWRRFFRLELAGFESEGSVAIADLLHSIAARVWEMP